MPTYEEVLNLAKRLTLADQVRLLKALPAIFAKTSATTLCTVEVEGTDEIISPEEIAESEAALQEY